MRIFSAQKKMGAEAMISVRGIVIPANWDNSGNVTSVAIASSDENEYLIEDQGLVEKLKKFLRKEVEVSGTVQRKSGKKIIDIKHWRSDSK